MTDTYRLDRRPGKGAKLCSRCQLWFLPGPRERVCFACLRPSERTVKALRDERVNPQVSSLGHSRTRVGPNERVKHQRRGLRAAPGRAVCMELAREEAEWDHWHGISHACRNPASAQAELTESTGRRHPYRGSRPEHSGYCVVLPCVCTCHVKAYGGTS